MRLRLTPRKHKRISDSPSDSQKVLIVIHNGKKNQAGIFTEILGCNNRSHNPGKAILHLPAKEQSKEFLLLFQRLRSFGARRQILIIFDFCDLWVFYSTVILHML